MRELDLDLTPDKLQAIGLHTVKAARDAVVALGPSGGERIDAPNQYGEIPILADIVAEREMYSAIRETGIPFRIEGEEIGVIETTVPGRSPRGILFFDGNDGSAGAEEYFKGSLDPLNTRFAIMLGVAATPDPTYGQIGFGASYELAFKNNTAVVPIEELRENPGSAGRLVYGTRGHGAYLVTPDGTRRLRSTHRRDDVLGPGSSVINLEYGYFGGDEQPFQKYATEKDLVVAKTLSSADHFIQLVTGEALPDYAIAQPVSITGGASLQRAPRLSDTAPDRPRRRVLAVAETGRKGMEEWPTNFRIGREAGIVFRTLVDGQPTDLRDLRVREFARNWFEKPRPKPPVIVAARNAATAEEVLLASYGMPAGSPRSRPRR